MIEKAVSYIGFFDSGVGGITVLRKAQDLMPHEHFLYFADSANVPYGNRSKKEILSCVLESIEQMMRFPLKAIVLACNTATSVAASALREKYDIPIIGMEPAVKPAVLEGDPRKILVLATELTLKEKKYKDLVKELNAEDKVDALPMQDLVMYAEEYDFESSELTKYVDKSFASVDWQDYKSVVLGCTHFIYFKSIFKKFIPSHIHYIDGHEGTLNHLSNQINKNAFGTKPKLMCMLSGLEVSSEVIQPYLNYLDRKTSMFVSTSN